MKFNRRLFGGYSVKQVNQYFQQIEQSYRNNLREHDEKRQENEDKIAQQDQELEKYRQQDMKLVEAIKRMDRKPGHERVIMLLNARVRQLEMECERYKAENQRLLRQAQILKETAAENRKDEVAAADPPPVVREPKPEAPPIPEIVEQHRTAPEPIPQTADEPENPDSRRYEPATRIPDRNDSQLSAVEEPVLITEYREDEDPDRADLLKGSQFTRRQPDQQQLEELEKVNRELGIL